MNARRCRSERTVRSAEGTTRVLAEGSVRGGPTTRLDGFNTFESRWPAGCLATTRGRADCSATTEDRPEASRRPPRYGRDQKRVCRVRNVRLQDDLEVPESSGSRVPDSSHAAVRVYSALSPRPGNVSDTDAGLWHPWLRINRLLRAMLHER